MTKAAKIIANSKHKTERPVFRHDMPRVAIINRYRMQPIIDRHSLRFQPTINNARLQDAGLTDLGYLSSKQFWVKKKKFSVLKRLRQVWNSFGNRTVRKLALIPFYYLKTASNNDLKYWYRHKFASKRRLLQRYFSFVRAVRRLKGRPRTNEFRNPVFNMFSFYWVYLGGFFARPNRKTASRAKSFLYWRASWVSQLALADPNATLAGRFYHSATIGKPLLRGLSSGSRFKDSNLWYERWWWAKIKQFLIRPISLVYSSRDSIFRSYTQNHELFSSKTGPALSEVGYIRTLKIRTLAAQESLDNSSVTRYAKGSLQRVLKNTLNSRRWHNIFGHPRYMIKSQSTVLIKSINFMHNLVWVAPFINAFVRQGSKYFVETYMQRAFLFLRVYLGWIFDFPGQIAQILDRGRPIFRFVTFVRKMKKRKRKTWTVPKVLFKNRGYVFGARKLWMRLVHISDDYKFIDRLILMMEEIVGADVLEEFVVARYEQAYRASRLRRWMRFLRKKHKRAKLRSILRISNWWRYGWNKYTGFESLKGVMQKL